MTRLPPPEISVLMTVFNREKYISEAIESILASSYKTYELIIVDDCSLDGSVEIARRYEAEDDRIKVYVNDKNLGQFRNRNKAASYAQGKYLKYVDSDDLIYPHTLSIMAEAMSGYPQAGLGFCYTIGHSDKAFPYLIQPEDAYRQHYFGGGLLYTGPIGLIIKKEAFEAAGCFEDYGMPSDNHLSLKIAAVYPIVALPNDLFFWRLHGDQAFSENDTTKNIFDSYTYNKDILSSSNCPLEAKERREAFKNNDKVLLRNTVKYLLKRRTGINEIVSFSKKYQISYSEIFRNIIAN